MSSCVSSSMKTLSVCLFLFYFSLCLDNRSCLLFILSHFPSGHILDSRPVLRGAPERTTGDHRSASDARPVHAYAPTNHSLLQAVTWGACCSHVVEGVGGVDLKPVSPSGNPDKPHRLDLTRNNLPTRHHVSSCSPCPSVYLSEYIYLC